MCVCVYKYIVMAISLSCVICVGVNVCTVLEQVTDNWAQLHLHTFTTKFLFTVDQVYKDEPFIIHVDGRRRQHR